MENHDIHLHEHEHTVYGELICHLPYAIFSVAFGLALLTVFTTSFSDTTNFCKSAGLLFHSFHFMHLVFAGTGTLITFLRFSSSIVRAIIIGIASPVVFCTLSDVILPYLGGRMMGVPMHFHLCFKTEWANVLPFLLFGVINGFVMSRHPTDRQGMYSVFSHAGHILISSLASAFYLVSHGFTNWYNSIGMVFIFLVIAVVIPCTLSDVVVPMIFAKAHKKL